MRCGFCLLNSTTAWFFVQQRLVDRFLGCTGWARMLCGTYTESPAERSEAMCTFVCIAPVG